MQIDDAVDKALRVIHDEVLRPTLNYVPSENKYARANALSVALSSVKDIQAAINITAQRKLRPRPVQESPSSYELKSVNFDLLLAIYQQVDQADRVRFLSKVLALLPLYGAKKIIPSVARYPTWNNLASSLPIMVELCIRTHHSIAI